MCGWGGGDRRMLGYCKDVKEEEKKKKKKER
jgi:hypothetical protein